MHGARIVSEVVGNEEMFGEWKGEMEMMAGRIKVGLGLQAARGRPGLPAQHACLLAAWRAPLLGASAAAVALTVGVRQGACLHGTGDHRLGPMMRVYPCPPALGAAGCAAGAVRRAGEGGAHQGLELCHQADWHVQVGAGAGGPAGAPRQRASRGPGMVGAHVPGIWSQLGLAVGAARVGGSRHTHLTLSTPLM